MIYTRYGNRAVRIDRLDEQTGACDVVVVVNGGYLATIGVQERPLMTYITELRADGGIREILDAPRGYEDEGRDR